MTDIVVVDNPEKDIQPGHSCLWFFDKLTGLDMMEADLKRVATAMLSLWNVVMSVVSTFKRPALY